MEKQPKTRVCKKCGKRKALEKFAKSKTCRFGYKYVCKNCDNNRKDKEKKKETDRLYYLNNKDKISKINKKYRIKNKEKIKVWMLNYRKKNKNKISERKKTWYNQNIKHCKEANHRRYIKNKKKYITKNKEWAKQHKWMKHYSSAKQRCINPKNASYKRYGGRGIKFLMTMEDFKFLWFRDKAYLMKKPSIDRIDNDGNYELSNCRFIELSENTRKMNQERKGNTK